MATKYKYDKDTDYQALIDRAVGNGEYGAAAVYEQQRNAKIAGEGMSYAPTLKYAAYLPYTITPDYDGSAREQAESLIGEATQSTAQDAAVQELLDALLGAELRPRVRPALCVLPQAVPARGGPRGGKRAGQRRRADGRARLHGGGRGLAAGGELLSRQGGGQDPGAGGARLVALSRQPGRQARHARRAAHHARKRPGRRLAAH